LNTATLLHPTAAVERFLHETADRDPAAVERRGSPRYRLRHSVRVAPLDEKLHAAGEPFQATCDNISAHGIALLHTRAVSCKYLLVEITESGRRLRLLTALLRCQRKRTFYEIAGKFVTRLAEAGPGDATAD